MCTTLQNSQPRKPVSSSWPSFTTAAWRPMPPPFRYRHLGDLATCLPPPQLERHLDSGMSAAIAVAMR